MMTSKPDLLNCTGCGHHYGVPSYIAVITLVVDILLWFMAVGKTPGKTSLRQIMLLKDNAYHLRSSYYIYTGYTGYTFLLTNQK